MIDNLIARIQTIADRAGVLVESSEYTTYYHEIKIYLHLNKWVSSFEECIITKDVLASLFWNAGFECSTFNINGNQYDVNKPITYTIKTTAYVPLPDYRFFLLSSKIIKSHKFICTPSPVNFLTDLFTQCKVCKMGAIQNKSDANFIFASEYLTCGQIMMKDIMI